MDHEIHPILERLRLIESDITPTNVKSGLNKQQKSVKQMPALFKPKTQKILGGDPNAKNPMSGYMVGGCEEGKELEEDHVQLQPGDRVCVTGPNEYQGEFAEVVELSPSGKFVTVSLENSGDEAHLHLSDVEYTADDHMVDDDDYDDSDDSEFVEDMFEDKHLEEESSEDMLTKVKASFADYLQNLEDNIKQDKDLLAKKREDFDLKKKKLKDLELQIKQKKEEQEEVEEAPEEVQEYEEVEEGDTYAQGGNSTYAAGGTSTYAECVLPVVKTVTLEDGSNCTIHGDEDNGFIIRRGAKQLPSKFDHLDHAQMALDMFRARQATKNRADDDSADYVEEK